MATDKINNYSIGDNNFESVMLTLDQTFRNKHDCYSFSATALKAGSVIEINGSLYPVTQDMTLPDMTSNKYLMAVPSSAGTFTLMSTATTPTWSHSKQGFYGTSITANYKYIAVKEGSVIYKYNDRPFYASAIDCEFINCYSTNELTHTFAANAEFIVLCPVRIVSAYHVYPTPKLYVYTAGAYISYGNIWETSNNVLLPGRYQVDSSLTIIFSGAYGATNISEALVFI